MSLQSNIQSRSSTNGHGRRRADREAKMHSGKLSSGDASADGVKVEGVVTPSRDRLIYVMTSLIGLPVEVHVRNGSIISGIFHATNAEKDFGIVLKMAKVIKDGSAKGQKSIADTVKKPQDMFIQSKDLFQVVAKDVPLNVEDFSNGHAQERRKDLMIDSAISHSQHLELGRQLERWAPDVDDPGCPELENIFDGKWNRKWDQFETNEALFGVTSTFDEELYTTKLERGPRTRELELEASRLAREIEGEETHDLHMAEERGTLFTEDFDFDEEIRYSAVKREVSDFGFDVNNTSLLGPHDAESLGSLGGSAIHMSYADVAKNNYPNSRHLSSIDSPMDEEQTSKIISNNTSTSNFIAKSSLFIKEETSLEKETSDQHEEDQSDCTRSTLPGETQRSKLVGEVQTSTDEKKYSPCTETNDLSLSELESKHSIAEPSEATLSADLSASGDSVNPISGTGMPKLSAPERIVTRTASSSALSPSTSLGSSSSEKSTLNPNAKEFKFNPNAKSFSPSAPFRQPMPVSEGPFFYPGNMSAVPPPMHSMPMGLGIGPSFGGPQPVYNAQAQGFAPPNNPYGQQMLVGQPRPVYYMPTYSPEMQYKGRNY